MKMSSRLVLGIVTSLAVAGLPGVRRLAATASAAELLTEDGVWTKAALADLKLTGGRLTVGRRTVPVERIIALRFQATAVAGTVESGIVLRNGDLLVGVVENLQAGKIQFLSDSFGRISPGTRSVLAFSFAPRGVLDLTESAAGPSGAELVNGDFVRGEVVFVNRETVGVAGGRRVVRVPRKRTSLVRLGPGPQAEEGAAVQYVRLLSGDRLSGSLRRLTEDVLELETAFAGAVEVPVATVAELWSEGGPIVPVSTLKPARVRQIPQFDESFPHRLDASQSGSFLSVGGSRFERGLGCHSRCELEYELPDGCLSFLAEIGIDDSACSRGEVVFRVLVDGKKAFESGPVRGGERPRTVSVALRRARRMRLVVDFGPDGSSVGDHADWGRAVLVRK